MDCTYSYKLLPLGIFFNSYPVKAHCAGRGRPRKKCADEKQERERELQRQRNARYQERGDTMEGRSDKQLSKGGRPRKEDGTEEEMEELRKRRERYEKGTGRPRAICGQRYPLPRFA